MYTKEQARQLQKISTDLLKKLSKGISKSEITSLREALRFHEYRYYILNDPLLADHEYDLLFKSL